MTELCDFGADDVDIIDKKPAYSGYFRIDRYHLRFRRFNGQWSQARDFELFERGQAVAVLPYDPVSNQLVLVEQFRMGAVASGSPWLLEIIAGIVEPGEALEDVARRESMEEAHCALMDLEPITKVYVSPGGSSESVQLYCARVDTSAIHQQFAGLEEECEDIRIHVVSYDEALRLLDEGKIISAPAVIALQWLQLNKVVIQQKWQ